MLYDNSTDIINSTNLYQISALQPDYSDNFTIKQAGFLDKIYDLFGLSSKVFRNREESNVQYNQQLWDSFPKALSGNYQIDKFPYLVESGSIRFNYNMKPDDVFANLVQVVLNQYTNETAIFLNLLQGNTKMWDIPYKLDYAYLAQATLSDPNYKFYLVSNEDANKGDINYYPEKHKEFSQDYLELYSQYKLFIEWAERHHSALGTLFSEVDFDMIDTYTIEDEGAKYFADRITERYTVFPLAGKFDAKAFLKMSGKDRFKYLTHYSFQENTALYKLYLDIFSPDLANGKYAMFLNKYSLPSPNYDIREARANKSYPGPFLKINHVDYKRIDPVQDFPKNKYIYSSIKMYQSSTNSSIINTIFSPFYRTPKPMRDYIKERVYPFAKAYSENVLVRNYNIYSPDYDKPIESKSKI